MRSARARSHDLTKRESFKNVRPLVPQGDHWSCMLRRSRAPLTRMSARALGTRVDHAKHALRTADAVCFDVDSTVINVEGIDELAAYLGCGEAVAQMTANAMGGSVPFHEALAMRLGVMQPSLQKLEAMMAQHPMEQVSVHLACPCHGGPSPSDCNSASCLQVLTPGISELVSALQHKNMRVYLVSGGFRQMINPVADAVGVARDDIYANNLLFSDDGAYAGFDEGEPTSRAGGKAKVVASLKAQHGCVASSQTNGQCSRILWGSEALTRARAGTPLW